MHCSEASVSASTSSPSRSSMLYEPPMSHLRDILTSASDIEHSSNDHIDVKDLSFRTGGGGGGGGGAASGGARSETNGSAASTTTTNGANGGATTVSTSSSANNHEAINGGEYEHSRGTASSHESHNDLELRLIRMRKFSETSSADLEHNNNSYKFKNYIKQRFSQDNHLDDKVGSSSSGGSSCSTLEKASSEGGGSKKRRVSAHADLQAIDEPSTVSEKRINGGHDRPLDMKIESHHTNGAPTTTTTTTNTTPTSGGAGNSSSASTQNGRHPSAIHSFAVPIFACHTQGYYIPLNIDYDTLLPFLGTIDLLNKNFSQMPPLHPISINVNYAPLKPVGATFVKPKLESVANGW